MNDSIKIIILIIIIIIIGILLINNNSNNKFTKVESVESVESEDSVDMRNKVYDTAYTLGMNYLKIMNYHKFFNLKHPAVMFDIDDTLINLSGKPIKPIIKLLNECIKLNLIVVIITARDYQSKDETIKELKKLDINYDLLYLRKPTDDIKIFKSKIKQYLKEADDITIILSLGDNLIDVEGEYSGYFLKLPNTSDPKLYHLNSDKKIEVVQ
jgi:predicted secreted acid phosphatase